MCRDDAVEVLPESAIFRGFSRAILAPVVAVATERHVRSGGAAFREGEPADRFYVVIAGRLRLTQVGADGNEVILRFVGPGEAAAALAVFAEDANVRTIANASASATGMIPSMSVRSATGLVSQQYSQLPISVGGFL